MTYHSVYIGYLDDPRFRWGTGSISGRPPTRRSPPFPDSYHSYNLFDNWVKSEQLLCKKVDWGASVAVATKDKIKTFVDLCHDSPSYTDPSKFLTWEGKAYKVEELKELKRIVDALDDSKEYAVVASET